MENFEDQMRQIAQDVHDQNSTTDQFAVSQTPFHTHNGSDSQRIPFLGLSDTPSSYHGKAGQSVVVNTTESGLIFQASTSGIPYLGYVNTDGSAGTPFPAGWTSVKTATGRYTVTHNLNTTQYVVVMSLTGNVFYLFTVFARSANSFDVRITNTVPAFQDSDFMFILSTV